MGKSEIFLRKKDKKRLSKKFLRKRLSQIFPWQDKKFGGDNFSKYFVALLTTTKIILIHFSSKNGARIIFLLNYH